MRRNGEKGQALVMAAVALGMVLIGAVGLALDTSHLYAHRQMAQAAADAAAQAAILSVFNATNVGGNAFAADTGYTHTCAAGDGITPCAYALKNGFGKAAGDTVYVDVPTADAIGLDPASLSNDTVNLLRVTITRPVSTWFIPMLGGAATANIKASAVAAIVGVRAATPILVTHPNLQNALSMNGSTSIKICGGPSQSIQINSASATALAAGGTIDLSKAGPLDVTGDCSAGTGADLGVLGGPAAKPGSVSLGTTGRYISPSSVILDPLASVPAPAVPAIHAGTFTAKKADANNYGCASTCTVYSPGLYVGGINIKNDTVIFKPGLYYMQGGGFTLKGSDGGGGAPVYYAMCTTCAADADTGTGMVVYDTGPAGSSLGHNPSGGFDINTNVQVTLQGSTKTTTNAEGKDVPAAPYYGILFWEDRTADAHTHSFGQGNGCFTLFGTIYATNTLAIMADPAHYQAVEYNGTPCSTTVKQGDIIVGSLTLKGNSQISMSLIPNGFLKVRRMALVQ